MKKPKASKNKAKDVEKPSRKAKLEQELGRLTFEIAKLKEQVTIKVNRSNQIGQELDKLNGQRS